MEDFHMPGTYRKIEIVGTSPVSFAEATKSGIAEASKTIENMSWFEVIDQRGAIRDGQVAEFQVVLRIGSRID
jgi:dodecin